MARNPENPKQIALPAEMQRLLARYHAAAVSQGYLGTAGDLVRELVARELGGAKPGEIAFTAARVAGSNRGYFFTTGQLRRVAKALYHFFEKEEHSFGLQHCPTCGGPILPEIERVLAELQDEQAAQNLARIGEGG